MTRGKRRYTKYKQNSKTKSYHKTLQKGNGAAGISSR